MEPGRSTPGSRDNRSPSCPFRGPPCPLPPSQTDQYGRWIGGGCLELAMQDPALLVRTLEVKNVTIPWTTEGVSLSSSLLFVTILFCFSCHRDNFFFAFHAGSFYCAWCVLLFCVPASRFHGYCLFGSIFLCSLPPRSYLLHEHDDIGGSVGDVPEGPPKVAVDLSRQRGWAGFLP